MNFLSMEYFIAVAAKRNITKAAEELHITQQTLSAHIAALEKELACQLLVRSNPLELTYAGEVFQRYALNFYENYQSMWNEFNDLTKNQRGKLLVGTDHDRSSSIMPTIITAFQSRYPNIEVRLTEGSSRLLQQSLLNKELDLAITNLPQTLQGMIIEDFYEEEIVMLVPKKLINGSGDNCGIYADDLSKFNDFPFIAKGQNEPSDQIEKGIAFPAGFHPVIKVRSDNMETRLLLCVKGTGICFCPRSFVKAVLTKRQLNEVRIFHFKTDMAYPIRFGYRKDKYQWNMVSEFMRIAREETLGGKF